MISVEPVPVYLAIVERQMVGREVDRRREYDARLGFKDNRGMALADSETKFRREWHGVAAEFVVAKYLGLPWSGRGGDPRDDRSDVDDDIEVKWSEALGLILKSHKPSVGPHFLVTSFDPYLIVGWYPVSQRDYRRPLNQSLPVPAIMIERGELLSPDSYWGHKR